MFDARKELKAEAANRQITQDRITVGLATCGMAAGAGPVFDALKNASLGINVEPVGCIGMCYNEPIVMVRQSGRLAIYAKVTIENVSQLINCIRRGEECSSLLACHDISELDFYKKQKRQVMENCGIISPLKIDQYAAREGYQGLKIALGKKPAEVVLEVKTSGLRGRGGAGFSTGLKWSFIADKPGKKYIICNGDEGDPGAFMNRTVMESDPFRIIEGMTIAGYATGTDEGIIYTRAEYPLAIDTLSKAIKIAYENHLLGKNIMGVKGFNFDISIQKGAGAFVCGEETALINSIEGKRGMPRPRPPYPAECGLYGRPTIINNVGTLANIPFIMRAGAAEYARTGTEKSKGTKEVCLTGKIQRSGVVEVPMGTTLREIVYEIGGGAPAGTKIKAVLTGGPAGGCIPDEKLDTPFDYETLQMLGAIMGSGGVVVINDEACMVEVARYFMNFTQQESCGKCTPCREGTKRLLEMLIRVTRGVGEEADIDKILHLCEFVRDNALCGLGQNACNPVFSSIKFFRDEYVLHLKEKRCSTNACQNLVSYFITEKCVGCGNCARNCPVQCISGKPRERHIIDQSKSIKCGNCHKVCAFKAVEKR